MNFILSFIFDSKVDYYMFTIIALLSSVLMLFVGYRLLQILQLTNYKIKAFFVWFRETKFSYFSRLFMLSFLSIASMLMTNVLLADFFVVKVLSYVSVLFYFLFCSLFITNLFTVKQKTPLVYTKRIYRLLVVYAIIVCAFTWFVGYLGKNFVPYLSFGLIGITPIFLPLFVVISFYITYPIERLIANSYISKAKKKLAFNKSLKVIGITGSYGKTSVKNILSTILSEKYKVCKSPLSYNTPLGIAKTILSNLSFSDEIFIAEMGAKQKGDIKELCNFVNPQIGIITGIGNQHLLTFGSAENIISAKGELAVFIEQSGGKIYFNTDNENASKLASKFKTAIKVSLKSGDLVASEIKTGQDGSTFNLSYNDKKVKCKTILLGKHNISNILLASRVALDLGLTLEDISNGISKLVTIPHRLEILKSTSTYTIIDDAYNGSVEGSSASLEVLSEFNHNRFIITPGLVELGDEQKKSNYEFGKKMAKVCDFVIINSQINFEAISSGLIDAGFDKEKIIQVGNLSQAVKMLNKHASPNDVVLFENDLPDNYS